MGQPDWSKIPFDKMPEWKRQELLQTSKQKVDEIEKVEAKEVEEFVCAECGKVCKSKAGLTAHSRVHNQLNETNE